MNMQRVPAWKRLGLKLKYADEDETTKEAELGSNGSGRKRKQEDAVKALNGSDDHHAQLKRLRLDNQTQQQKLSKELHDESSKTSEVNTSKRKKSVTFTSDTKIVDGDTAQTIQHWIPDSPGSTPKKVTDQSETVESVGSLKKPKREKRPKGQRTTLSSVAPRKPTAALAYLSQFHHQRSTWKFNKNHETWILKHALSSEQIPPEYNLALALYVRGLKSTGSRQRLIEQSCEALKQEEAPGKDSSEIREKFILALEPFRDHENKQGEQEYWLANLSRSKVILLSFDENLEELSKQSRRNGHVLPRVKKNKSRTSRIGIQSSSSSESESGDDSDSSDSEMGTGTPSMGGKERKDMDAESTSSSGSSSSFSTDGRAETDDNSQPSSESD